MGMKEFLSPSENCEGKSSANESSEKEKLKHESSANVSSESEKSELNYFPDDRRKYEFMKIIDALDKAKFARRNLVKKLKMVESRLNNLNEDQNVEQFQVRKGNIQLKIEDYDTKIKKIEMKILDAKRLNAKFGEEKLGG